MATLEIHHRVPREDIAFGVVLALGVRGTEAPAALAEALDEAVAERAAGDLEERLEANRKAARDILRNGRYKPTGRGKPASEYLLRTAASGEFPRINGPVDANNLVSLSTLLPISVWDLDRAGSDHFELRLGAAEERYVFNSAGQSLDLEDLVCGCALDADGTSRPIVTPIKDGMATKILPETARAGGVIYAPAADAHNITEATASLAEWLGRCGDEVSVSSGVLRHGETLTL